MSVIITAKIPRKLKEEAKKYSINISKLVREALEREIRRRKLEEIKRLQKEARKIREKISVEDFAETMREVRNEA